MRKKQCRCVSLPVAPKNVGQAERSSSRFDEGGMRFAVGELSVEKDKGKKGVMQRRTDAFDHFA
jgi:hypothetical protein